MSATNERYVNWPLLAGVILSLAICVLVWSAVYAWVVEPIHDVMPALVHFVGRLFR